MSRPEAEPALTEPCTCSALQSDSELTVARKQCPRHGTHGSPSAGGPPEFGAGGGPSVPDDVLAERREELAAELDGVVDWPTEGELLGKDGNLWLFDPHEAEFVALCTPREICDLHEAVGRLQDERDEEKEGAENAWAILDSVQRGGGEALVERLKAFEERYRQDKAALAVAVGRVERLEEALTAIITLCEDANQAWARLDVASIARAALAGEPTREARPA